MTVVRVITAALLTTLILSALAGTAHADMRELDRATAKQELANTPGVVLVDVYAYW